MNNDEFDISDAELKEFKSILRITTSPKLELRQINQIRHRFMHDCKFLSESFVNNTFNEWDS